MTIYSDVASHRRPRTRLRAFAAVAVVAVLLSGLADSSCEKTPPPSVGHNPERAGEPDPAPHQPTPSRQVRQLRFTVEASVATVVTYNAGHGNKFLENVKHDVWYVPSYSGASVYLGALPARRDTRGTIHVKIDYGTDNELVCFDTNFGNTRAGADCHGRVR
jgi:hypothetical protein